MDSSTQLSEWKPRGREYLTMASLCVVSLAVALDSTLISTSLPTIATELKGSNVDAFWIGTSYLLACAVFQPFITALSGVFGRQQLLITSSIFFFAGSLTTSLAQTITTMLIGRSIQGVGGGGIITLGLVIVTDIFPLRHRPKWYGLIQAAWAVGTVIGPLIGGCFVQYLSWRWLFYVNLPLCGVGLAASIFAVRLDGKSSSLKEKFLMIDWIGGAAFSVSLTGFLIAVSWGGVQYKWASFQTLVPLILGAMSVIGSLWWEWRWVAVPFLPRGLFANRSALSVYLCAFIQGYMIFSQLYYIPLYLLSVKNQSPVFTGVRILPITCTLMPSAVITGYLITALGRFRWAIWLGEAITTSGTIMLIFWDANTSSATLIVVLIILGLGNGLTLSSLNVATQAVAKTKDSASAANMYSFMRALGMALGVSVSGTAFSNFMRKKLLENSLPTSIAAHAEDYVAVFKALPNLSPFKEGVLRAYVQGCRGVFEVMTGLSTLALLSSLIIEHVSIDERVDSSHQQSLGELRVLEDGVGGDRRDSKE